jgi:hypothetical protein
MLAKADLRNDIAALRALVCEQSRMLAVHQAQAAELVGAKGEADVDIQRLWSIISAFMRHRFGARSEQLFHVGTGSLASWMTVASTSTLNRKNALFAGSDEGGDNWAVIATLIENCKLSGINPHDWLTRTLTALANGHPANRVHELMPWIAVA